MALDDVFATGKLPLEFLQGLLAQYTSSDPRLITGPRVGEDVAAIDMGDRYMVIKTDPITFATDQIGWYAVNVNANDIATSGARPLWMLNTILLPAHKTTPALVESIFAQLHDACSKLGIVLVGGHTEVTWGLDRPIVVGVLVGEVEKDKLITTAGAQVGDQVLLVRGIPIEATALIAHEKVDDLRQRGYGEEFIRKAQNYLYDPGISVVAAARLAVEHGRVHAMHDPTEGGLATGLHELAFAAGTGLCLDVDSVPILEEGRRLCAEYGLDPLGAIASGSLLVVAAPQQAASLLESYARQGIPCARIGEIIPAEAGVYAVQGGVRRSLPRYDKDEISRIF
ncbi:MAG: hydrogenase expression/formation protein [Chloroflexi bacterium]|jgi:hydrogenase expression/formation protein HypE|nr:hydrogenase expression/formation protein [Chloroflexota bacterium]